MNFLSQIFPERSAHRDGYRPLSEKQIAIGRQKMFQPITYDQVLYRRRERRTKLISARHFCSRSPMSPSRKWTRKSEKRYNPSLWADLSGKICDKKFISTLHKNNSFVRRLQNCVEWYGPFSPWHPSFNESTHFIFKMTIQ